MTLFLYAPSAFLGGTETLALRIANELRARGEDVTLVVAPEGWLAGQARAAGLPQLAPEAFAGQARDAAAGSAVLSSAKYLPDAALAPWRARTLFWLLHPLEFAWTRFRRIFGLYRHLDARACGRVFALTAPLRFAALKAECRELEAARRLLSMSEDCTDFLARFLGRPLALPLVPLPIESAAAPAAPPAFDAPTRFAYFGRIEEFKTAALRRLIDDIAASGLPAEARSLVLFGYGADEARVQAHAQARGVRLEITGRTTTPEVVARVRAERLLTFAMGLSGLDLLLAGVPCVFLPIPKSLRDTSGAYAFLHQLPRGCVGAYPEFLDPARAMDFAAIRRAMGAEALREALARDLVRIAEVHALAAVVDQVQARLHGIAAR